MGPRDKVAVDAFMSGITHQNMAFIGFGEAAQALAQGWGEAVCARVCAFDVKTDSDDEVVSQAKWADYERFGVTGVSSLVEALETADVVFSLVTADQAGVVAKDAAGLLKEGATYLECNSCAPDTKRRNAGEIVTQGAQFVDVAIMAPVHPKLHHTPMSVCGPHAVVAKAILEDLDMKVTLIEGDVGTASSIKMIRSVMMKGMEALFAECVLAGRKAGVENQVLDSLDKTYPGFDFHQKAAYMLERSMTHGRRRAAEMREVALTLGGLGLPSDMAQSTVIWQQRLGDMMLDANEVGTCGERAAMVLAAMEKE